MSVLASDKTTEAMRGIEIIVRHGLPETERDDALQLRDRLSALASEEAQIRASGQYTETGIGEALRGKRAATLKWLGSYEGKTELRRSELEDARASVAAGRVVQDGAGWSAAKPVALDAAGAVRAMEIRQHVRTLNASDRLSVVTAAVESGDREVLHALEHAPASLQILGDAERTFIRTARLASFDSEFMTKMQSIDARQRLAANARAVLGL